MLIDLSEINPIYWQWWLLIFSSIALFIISPRARSKNQFFSATLGRKAPGFLTLTGSLIISWVFAKSITNAANLGLDFGIVGGLAYAGYYLSFAVAGVVIYLLRTKGGYNSIHHFLISKFGRGAIAIFSILISIKHTWAPASDGWTR